MLEAIVFDFDGIIVDSEPLHYRAFLDVLRPMGVSFDYQTYLQRYIGFDDRDCFAAVCTDHGIEVDGSEIRRLIAGKAHAFARIVRGGVRTYPGVIELIDSARSQLKLAICSGALRADIDLILRGIGDPGNPGDPGESGLADAFTVVVSADDVVRSKPDPQSYVLAAQRLGIAAGSCLAIEDTAAGLRAAREAGMRTLAVTNTCAAEHLGDAECVVDCLADVSVDQLRQWF